MTASGTETEIKIPVPELETLRARLLEAGAAEKRATHDEDNTLYDDPGGRLSQEGCALRLRVAEGRGIVTFKGPASFEGNVKSRKELQNEVDEPETFRAILGRIGLVPRFRYEKRRQELELLGCTVCLDETPIGCFVEVEGEVGEIFEVLRCLGLRAEDAVRDSYAGLYARARQKDPTLPSDMLFPR